MSEFQLQDLGEGRFALGGSVSFESADRILKSSSDQFGRHTSIVVDLSNVGTADSAGLALLLEWKAQAQQRGADIQFQNIPDSLLAIARTCEVSDLI